MFCAAGFDKNFYINIIIIPKPGQKHDDDLPTICQARCRNSRRSVNHATRVAAADTARHRRCTYLIVTYASTATPFLYLSSGYQDLSTRTLLRPRYCARVVVAKSILLCTRRARLQNRLCNINTSPPAILPSRYNRILMLLINRNQLRFTNRIPA